MAGAHGHSETMKCHWPAVLQEFWNRLAIKCRKFGIRFLAGDFNMSFTEVTKQLRSRGIECDCIAWYPWIHATQRVHDQSLGLDSCGIFYLGGTVEVSMPWSVDEIDVLTAVAEDEGSAPLEEADNPCTSISICPPMLDQYRGQNHPGQHWGCYRSKSFHETNQDRNLRQRLVDLLTPSTTPEELRDLQSQKQGFYCPYLRLRQKRMDKEEWLVRDISKGSYIQCEIHNGAHFPLCVFTNNARARSEEKCRERNEKRWRKKWQHSSVAQEVTRSGGWTTTFNDWWTPPVADDTGGRPQWHSQSASSSSTWSTGGKGGLVVREPYAWRATWQWAEGAQNPIGEHGKQGKGRASWT